MNKIRYKLDRLRPANMRLTHGLRGFKGLSPSVSSVRAVEDSNNDIQCVSVTGGGMDAPEDIPTGSVKAFFGDNGGGQYTRFFSLCQRTTNRTRRKP